MDVLGEVIDERARQDEKWGVQDHNPFVWIAIILEELGEASKAQLQFAKADYRTELIEVAASAVAAIECLDRNPDERS